MEVEMRGEVVMDSTVAGILASVVTQLHGVQDNIRSCQDTTIDSGVDTSDKLDRVDDDLASIISEVKSIQQGKKEQKLLNSDNTNSIMENITLALSNLELNVNKDRVLSRADSSRSPVSLSEDDSLERMVDQLFKNVRSLKSILVEETVETDQDIPLSDDSEQLSKLIEHLSNSISNTRSHHLSSEAGSRDSGAQNEPAAVMSVDYSSEDMCGTSSVEDSRLVGSCETESCEEGMVSRDERSQCDTGSRDDSMRDAGEGWEDQGRGRQTYDSHEHLDTDKIFEESTESYNYSGTEETHDMVSEVESESDSEGSVSTSLEYGYIPVNYTIVGNISQCKTPTPTPSPSSGEQIISVPHISYSGTTSGDFIDEPRRNYRVQHLESDDNSLVSCDLSFCGEYGLDDNGYLTVDQEQVYRNLALLPQLPVPLKRSKKDVIDIYNKINQDMNSLTRMVEPESSYSDSSHQPPLDSTSSHHPDRHNMYNVSRMLSDNSQPPASNSADRLLSGIKHEAGETRRLLDIDTSDDTSRLSSRYIKSGRLLSGIKKEAVETHKVLDICDSEEKVSGKLPSSTSNIISEALEEDDKTGEEVDLEFIELMRSVNRANKRIERLRNDPTVQVSPGEVPQDEAEWDDFTPILETPPRSRNTNKKVSESVSETDSELTYHTSRSSFTEEHLSPQLSLPQSSPPSSPGADREVRMVTRDYPDSDTSLHISDPEHWPIAHAGLEVITKDHLCAPSFTDAVVSVPLLLEGPREDLQETKSKRKLDMSGNLESKPSVEELIINVESVKASDVPLNDSLKTTKETSSKQSSSKTSSRTSIKSSMVNKSLKTKEFSKQTSAIEKPINVNDPFDDHPKHTTEEIPDFLRLFVRPGDRMEDYVPNTALLNALLANSGLTIIPITQKVDASINTKYAEDTSDRTSNMSDDKSFPSLDEDRKIIPKESSKSGPVTWVTGSRPPKLENLTKPSSLKSASTGSPVTKSHSRSLIEAMGGQSDKSLSKHSSKSRKPKILLNKKAEPEQMYNVPKSQPSQVLTFDTWTCTDPEPKTAEKGVETTSVQTEDRALSPIITMEFPKMKKLKKTKKSKAPALKATPAPASPPIIAVTETPMLTVPARTTSKPNQEDDPASWKYDGNEVPELSDYHDKALPSDEKSDKSQNTTISEKLPSERLPSIKEEDLDDTISSGDDGISSDDETSGVVIQVKGKNCDKKDKLKEDLNKALLDALQGKTKINPATLRGLKAQIIRQSTELEGARNRLADAGSRVRSMAQMFNMERPSATPLDELM
ncbi:serine-rich adhesin for platelets-like [Bolinopsis microptera]|uniref:serine-rich adhesin for platelets-like n=1 Tax=Bolinopsis microptera TaxID=2820187 RepID=UPI00307AD4EB